MPSELAERIIEDCRRAVGDVRFGFGSKHQVWAFEERHTLDVRGLVEELAKDEPAGFLELAVRFHDEFEAVANAWRVRDRIQALTADLCRSGGADFLKAVGGALVNERLAVRHWLVAACLAGPPGEAFDMLEEALPRAYQPADQWAVLSRLETLASEHEWAFGVPTTATLAELARLSSQPEHRCRALDLLAGFCRTGGSALIARAAKADADPEVRAHAAQLLHS